MEWEQGGRLDFYLESAQLSLFFKKARALHGWLAPMTQTEKKTIESSVRKRPEACYQIVSDELSLDK